MPDTEHKVTVEDPALGVLHLMATKGMIKLVADPSLNEHSGRIHISSNTTDKSAPTLYINRGDDAELGDVYPPRVPNGGIGN